MMEVLQNFLDLVFPRHVSVKELETLAKSGRLSILPRPPELPEQWMQALWAYKNAKVRQLVWEIKYGNNRRLTDAVGALLADEILAYFEERTDFAAGQWVLVPIPASKPHLKEKGFSQTEELCRAVMRALGQTSITYAPQALRKVRETEPQAKVKNRAMRLRNLVGAFEANTVAVAGKHVVIVDDVITTGSTMTEAKRALKVAGAKQIVVLAIAH